MSNSDLTTFRAWLQQKIRAVLPHKPNHIPFVIWCDPQRQWQELLKSVLVGSEIELWADEVHELILRNRFFSEPPASRVIWLPMDQKEIGYFKVYALQAEQILQIGLPEALDEYGVNLPAEQIQKLAPILPAHVLQWIDYPLSYWKEKFSPDEVTLSLIDDETLLAFLAAPGQGLAGWLTPERLPVLNRRAVEDFGLPPLYAGKVPPDLAALELENWRVRCTAALLVTEADALLPAHPPGDRDKVILNPAARDQALKLLALWQNKFDQAEAFQELAPKADALTALPYWAKNLPELPAPLASPAVEAVLFQQELETLAHVDTFEDLAERFSRALEDYTAHAQGFWGKRAKKRVDWAGLVQLAQACQTLRQQAGVEKSWRALADATTWFVESGWRADWAGEQLFKENDHLPGALTGVRSKLRQAYQRHLDRVNTAFAELAAQALAGGSLPQPYAYAGVQLAQLLPTTAKQPTAVILTDACRYDIGCRLVETLNQGEPTRRAQLVPACAPLPSITPLGMTLALPGIAGGLRVQLSDDAAQPWLITAERFAGNLAEAAQRREWLKQNFKVKDQAFLSIDQVLNSDSPEALSAKTLGRLVFVFGDQLDDHEGVLKPFGLDAVIERYASLIRRLQSAGYPTIHLLTDHGFFHWEPAPDEKDVAKPAGELRWKSRRAVVGHDLQHPTALHLALPGSPLECCIPRSVNSFKTYGGLGFFHGGLTLQEWIIPLVSVHFPQKGQKIGAVLKPLAQITSLAQRVQVAPEAIQLDLYAGGAPENYLSRPVLLKVVQPATGKMIFRSKNSVMLEPGGATLALELAAVPGAAALLKSELELRLLDADDEELLDSLKVTLQVELDDWA